MRPPTSESEPETRAVLIGSRALWASTASRVCGVAAVAASGAGVTPAVGAGGVVASGAVSGAGAVSSVGGREGVGEEDRAENEPAQQHEEAERRRQDQVPALVVHCTTPVRLADKADRRSTAAGAKGQGVIGKAPPASPAQGAVRWPGKPASQARLSASGMGRPTR